MNIPQKTEQSTDNKRMKKTAIDDNDSYRKNKTKNGIVTTMKTLNLIITKLQIISEETI